MNSWKRFGLTSLVGIWCIWLQGCGSTTPVYRHEFRLATLHNMSQIRADREPVLIELMPGDKIPVALFLDGNFLQARADPKTTTLVVQRHVYLLFSNKEPQVSFDKQHFQSLFSLKGSLSMGLHATKNGTQAQINLTANAKE
jgi:hypothetical protein